MSAFHDWIRQGLPLYVELRGFYLLPLAAIALVIARYLFRKKAATLVLLGALGLTAVFSVAVYNNFFNFHYGAYLNPYEFFHYYMGSKYTREIGYFDLYDAALVADAETGGWYRPADGLMADLRTYTFKPAADVLREPDRVRSRFTPARWESFVRDVAVFRERLGPRVFSRVLRDKGYSGTPVWSTVVGGALASRVPAGSRGGMFALSLLDGVLLLSAIAGVWWAFGAWPALLMAVFLSSSYLMAHVHMKGALLRTDFVVSLVLAVCLLKRRRPGLAGVLVGYATCSRVFPAVFLFGPAAGVFWESLAAWRRPGGGIAGALSAAAAPRHLRFFGGFLATVLVLVAASLLWAGPPAWTGFVEKITLHRAEAHIWNVGFETTLIPGDADRGGPPTSPEEFLTGRTFFRTEELARRKPVLRAVQALMLLVCLLAVRGLADHRAFAFGFVPMFFLVAPTYYYYIVLLVPFLFLAERADKLPDMLGVCYLFLVGMAGYWFYGMWDQYFPTYYWSSVLLLGLSLLLTGLALAESRRVLMRGT